MLAFSELSLLISIVGGGLKESDAMFVRKAGTRK
jgi:hypothetical protein